MHRLPEILFGTAVLAVGLGFMSYLEALAEKEREETMRANFEYLEMAGHEGIEQDG